MKTDEIYSLSRIDPWFLNHIAEIVEMEGKIEKAARRIRDRADKGHPLPASLLWEAKQYGFSDRRLAHLCQSTEEAIRCSRQEAKIEAVFKRVDTCGAEFVAHTPYLYSTYERECEADPTDRKKIVILGSGPNRIGQGIEFDYCCVHGAMALKEAGFETIMVNCNPETVSTDYDTSDRLYFEPLTLEDVLNIVRKEEPAGVIVQFGGQTPLKLAVPLEQEGVKILGTSPDAIDRAEDRDRFQQLLNRLGLKQAPNGTATSVGEAERIAEQIGYPVLLRPSYVLGGRAMEILYDAPSLRQYMASAVQASYEHPVLVDKFIEDALEIDVDALSDGQEVVVAGIMEHIEEAGIHSGDSACSIPPRSISPGLMDELREQTRALALELGVVGLINIQFAIKEGQIYVLEVNPRASRTVPFVSKAVGVPLAKLAAKLMVGYSLKDLDFTEERRLSHVAVKEVVLPFVKFPGVDPILGPEMRSTGEVMGIDASFGGAYAKSQIAINGRLPLSGTVFLSVRDGDKRRVVPIARSLSGMGFRLVATRGTAQIISGAGIPVEQVFKVTEGQRPHIVDRMKNNEIALVINTPEGRSSRLDSYSIRRTAITMGIPYTTTIAGAQAAVEAIAYLRQRGIMVRPLQDYYRAVEEKRIEGRS
jgi:carbamoyl-phosphate synthase large subunit